MNLCKNHPTVAATGKCQTCHLPICDECTIRPKGLEGTFCSQACADKYRRYQQTYGEKLQRSSRVRPQSAFTMLFKFIAIVAVVIAAAWAVAKFIFGEELSDLIRRIIG